MLLLRENVTLIHIVKRDLIKVTCNLASRMKTTGNLEKRDFPSSKKRWSGDLIKWIKNLLPRLSSLLHQSWLVLALHLIYVGVSNCECNILTDIGIFNLRIWFWILFSGIFELFWNGRFVIPLTDNAF